MTAVQPGLVAALCPACRHPGRLHGLAGCTRAECFCLESMADAVPVAAPAVPAAPSGRALDALDPVCRCLHRRGRHAQSGTATPCRRCPCRNFTTEEATDAPAAPPSGPPPAAARPAGPPARGEGRPVDRPAARPAGRAGAGDGLKAPRRQDPRPAEDRALVTPAVVGEGDADEEVAAAVTVATVAAATDLTPAEAYAAREAQRLADLVAQVLDRALYSVARWYCPRCHYWPLDPGACEGCRAPLQPVYLATIPRSLT
jgi:hypothetical protein